MSWPGRNGPPLLAEDSAKADEYAPSSSERPVRMLRVQRFNGCGSLSQEVVNGGAKLVSLGFADGADNALTMLGPNEKT